MARNSEDKGTWAEVADEGIVPDELGENRRDDEDPQLGSAVTGRETGSQEPATEEGVDRQAGDRADATADGGVKRPEGAEPDLKDAAQPPRSVDL